MRLVRLLPGATGDPLRCKIITSDLELKPDFEAVSYVWGTENAMPMLNIDTEAGERRLEITQNLAAGLRRFRYSSSIRTLWVDSICIDQSSNEEKTLQVPMMGTIYRQATRVLIWLGEEPNQSKVAGIDLCITRLNTKWPNLSKFPNKLMGIIDLLPNEMENSGWRRTYHHDVDELHSSLGIPLLRSPEFQATLELLRNPWFARAWTWQESFVARDRLFYRSGFSWPTEQMMLACKSINALYYATGRSDDYGLGYYYCLRMLREPWVPLDKKYKTLLDLLEQRRGSGCKDARDLVYSLIGAAMECPHIPVDYNEPFETVFARTAWEITTQRGDLRILRHLERRNSPLNLPTWVPDWRVKVWRHMDSLTVFDETLQYRATGSSCMLARVSSDHRLLSVTGLLLDRIVAIRSYTGNDTAELIPLMFIHQDQEPVLYPPSSEPWQHALRRVCFLDTTDFEGVPAQGRWEPNSHAKFEQIFQNYESQEEGRIRFESLLRALRVYMTNRAIFVTEQGRIGMAVNTIQPGDSVTLLLGHDLPVILRSMNESGHFRYVADCYMHGFMDGEALIEARKAADPTYDPEDESWLEKLHEIKLPFPVKDFHIH